MVMRSFKEEQQRLQNELLALGNLVEKALVTSVDALKRRDLTGSQQLIVLEQQIRKKRFAVEMDCLTLIATQRLSDRDMRAITAMLEIATELERIGAYAGDTARIPFMVIEQPLLALLVDVYGMAIKAQEMLQRAMQAFISRDLGLARAVLSEGREVDDLYNRLYRDLLGLVKGKSRKNGSRAVVNQARYLSRVARNLKRAADHVAAICQWGVFCVTGDVSRMEEESIVVTPEYPSHAQEVVENAQEESMLSC